MEAMAKEDAQAKKNEETKVKLLKDSQETIRQLNNATMQSMEDAFVNFVTTGKGSFRDLVDDMISQLKRLLAKKIFKTILNFLGGGLGSLFSGFFDQGGIIPAGKFGIVGEKGPEIVTGPANVIGRMETQGILANENQGSGQPTNVTYNINATDAQSFRDMIAQDPSFIFNVTRAGARLQPI
jgi:phage-related minor tail protein